MSKYNCGNSFRIGSIEYVIQIPAKLIWWYLHILYLKAMWFIVIISLCDNNCARILITHSINLLELSKNSKLLSQIYAFFSYASSISAGTVPSMGLIPPTSEMAHSDQQTSTSSNKVPPNDPSSDMPQITLDHGPPADSSLSTAFPNFPYFPTPYYAANSLIASNHYYPSIASGTSTTNLMGPDFHSEIQQQQQNTGEAQTFGCYSNMAMFAFSGARNAYGGVFEGHYAPAEIPTEISSLEAE